MDYMFNGEIAQEYGVEEAVFLHNLYWWIRKNEANGRHYYDGRSWTYNSTKAFAKLFPFWTEKQIRRIVKKLEDRGVLYVGNYNEKGFDRTQWYALDESIFQAYGTVGSCAQTGECICPNGQMEVPKREDASAQTGTPIPDSKPDNKPDSKPSTGFAAFWEAYPLKRGKGDAEKAWKKIKPDKELVGTILEALERAKASRDWTKENGKYIPYPSKWLNGKRWEDEYQPPAARETENWKEAKRQLEGDEIW